MARENQEAGRQMKRRHKNSGHNSDHNSVQNLVRNVEPYSDDEYDEYDEYDDNGDGNERWNHAQESVSRQFKKFSSDNDVYGSIFWAVKKMFYWMAVFLTAAKGAFSTRAAERHNRDE